MQLKSFYLLVPDRCVVKNIENTKKNLLKQFLDGKNIVIKVLKMGCKQLLLD